MTKLDRKQMDNLLADTSNNKPLGKIRESDTDKVSSITGKIIRNSVEYASSLEQVIYEKDKQIEELKQRIINLNKHSARGE